MAAPVLRVENLRTYFRTPHGTARAVDDMSFSIQRGSTFALVGESGCGKSVTALSVMQLVPRPAGYHAGGRIWVGDTDVTKLPENDKRRFRGDRVSMIFQDPMTSLNPVFTIGFQIVEAIRTHRRVSKDDAWDQAERMLRSVNIPDPAARLRQYPHQLSGGMRQRAMIAMALARRPDVLIADEPTTALDVTVEAQILDLMEDLQEEIGMAILLITHDLGIVREHADEVAVMYAGKIVEQAPTSELFESPRHPYTEALFRSLPSRHKRGADLEVIRGLVPLATRYPDGCRFADRCDYVMPHCASEEPASFPFASGQHACCHLYAPGAPRDLTRCPDSPTARPTAVVMPPRVCTPAVEQGRTGEDLVEVRNLQTFFPIRKGILKRTVGYVRAVDDVSLAVPPGTTLAIVGESGCGKTTLGKSILRLIEPTDGRIFFLGRDITTLPRSDVSALRSDFQLIFQDPDSSLDPRMMVREIIEEGMTAQHRGGSTRAERDIRIAEVMGLVGLDASMMDRYPHEFSGGQRQRIAIARVLAVDPKFIVCDEPTSALDVSVQAQILNLLKELQGRLGLSYLFITHDLSVVEYLADEVAVMYLGRIVERGLAEEVFASPKHPYTRALLSAVPTVDQAGVKKIRLEGDVPSPVNPPRGCHFHTRCPEVFGRCSEAYPGDTRFTETHACRCFLYDVEPPVA